MHRVNWDDLRFLLAVADQGSVASGARVLGVNHTTVLRRMHAFEEANKIRLFERLPTGYVLTAEGEQLVATARHIDDKVSSLERRITGQDLKLEGIIRLTTTDTLMTTVLPRHIASFRRQHPNIAIELVLSNSRLNLTKRDADIAIRAARDLPSPLVGERVSDLGFAVYGARSYLESHPADLFSSNHIWLGGDEMLANSPATDWMRQHVPDQQIALRADSFIALQKAAGTGMGLVALPCCLADADPTLMRLDVEIDSQGMGIWVLTHQDLSSATRIRAFVDHMTQALAGDQERFSGRRSPEAAVVKKAALQS